MLAAARAGGPAVPKYKLYVVVVAGIIIPDVKVVPPHVKLVVANMATVIQCGPTAIPPGKLLAKVGLPSKE
jgi:hypothetical protein